MIVDGVKYDEARIREILIERHQLAHGLRDATRKLKAARMDVSFWRESWERDQVTIERLKARLDRAGSHLRLRTAALHRVIARKGPHFD